MRGEQVHAECQAEKEMLIRKSSSFEEQKRDPCSAPRVECRLHSLLGNPKGLPCTSPQNCLLPCPLSWRWPLGAAVTTTHPVLDNSRARFLQARRAPPLVRLSICG